MFCSLFFASLFLQVYLSRAFEGLIPLGAAELIGFAAIASVLQRLSRTEFFVLWIILLSSWEVLQLSILGEASAR